MAALFGRAPSGRQWWDKPLILFLVTVLTFAGVYPIRTLINIILTGYSLKVAYEILATPLTYFVINWLKRIENSDPFDRQENLTPFSFGDRSPLDAD